MGQALFVLMGGIYFLAMIVAFALMCHEAFTTIRDLRSENPPPSDCDCGLQCGSSLDVDP